MLDTLKQAGEATVDDVASELGITLAGARQHLSALCDEGLVAVRDGDPPERGRGRPRKIYTLTDRAEPLFPKAYGQLTNELLDFAGQQDGALIARVFSRRRDARIDRARARLASREILEDRVNELTRILDEDGYLADRERRADGSWLITEHNCAILAVARRHPWACRSEIEFIQAVLPEASVERISHIVAGAHQCTYLVTPRAERAT